MIFLPDTNACITLLRQRNTPLVARWPVSDTPPTVPDEDSSRAWTVLRSMTGTLEGPADWSQELDHYLYGTPQRGESNE